MLVLLPEILDGLLNILGDTSPEIKKMWVEPRVCYFKLLILVKTRIWCNKEYQGNICGMLSSPHMRSEEHVFLMFLVVIPLGLALALVWHLVCIISPEWVNRFFPNLLGYTTETYLRANYFLVYLVDTSPEIFFFFLKKNDKTWVSPLIFVK